MTSCYTLRLFVLSVTFSYIQTQAYPYGNAFDALDDLGCSKFKSIIIEAQLEETFRSPQALTLFVFNDTAYAQLPTYRLGTLYHKTIGNNLGAKEYVNSFMLTEAVETSAFSDTNPVVTYSVRNRKVFLNKRELYNGNVASGIPGPTKYFCNGAMIIRPNIQAGQHLIHIIDQVLDMPLEDNALAYVAGYNPSKLTYLFFSKIMEILRKAQQEAGEYNYTKHVQQILAGKQVTFFIPSDQALNLIPSQKLNELRDNTRRMLEIITLHIIPNQVLYTSLVNHNETFTTQFNSGAVVFRKHYDKEAVYVTGALKGGRTVTAKINPGNTTVLNGVVHQIDAMLGFVYNTALEEIQIDPNTQKFEELIYATSEDLQSYTTATTGVVVFVPTNPAMYAIANVYPNYINNQSLVNMVLEMSLLQEGQSIYLIDYNGGYEAYKTAVSRYNGRLIKVYTEGDDIWVEGGYVKARVIKPDIGVTNGAVHQIDAVFGIPTRDIPYTVFCEDWLVSTYIQLKYVGLDAYMRDPTLTRNQDCVFSASAAAGQVPPAAGTWQTNEDVCGDGLNRCEFTFFVPNGTAIDNFAMTVYGRQIMNDEIRWRWLFRRLITTREKIYIEQLAYGAPRTYIADNGEEIIIQTDFRSTYPSGQRTTYIMFGGVRAQVIHSDIGATNGVIHIISSLLFVPDDLYMDFSKAVPIEVKTFDVNGSKSIKANYGDSVVLHCEVTGSGGTFAVLSGPELSTFKNHTLNTAVIDKPLANLNCKDSGRYFCWGQNGGGEKSLKDYVDINITCLVEPPPVYQGKQYQPQKQITVSSEKNTTFEFVVYGYPEPTSYDLRIQTKSNSYTDVNSTHYDVRYMHLEPPFGLVTLTIFDENTKETITYVLGINSEKGRVNVTVEVVKVIPKPPKDDTTTQMAIGIGVGVGGFLIIVVIVVVCTVKCRRSRTPAVTRGVPMEQLYDKAGPVYNDRHYALAYENKIANDYDLPQN